MADAARTPGQPDAADGTGDTDAARHIRVFVTPSYLRLWIAQVASSLGDWVGIVAITALAKRIGGSSAVGFALAARFLPGFFLAPLAGVLVDRANRKRVMVLCDIGRALLLLLIPFVETVWGLVLISLGLEVLTLLWSPAKDASVPNLVPNEKIAQVGSLSMAAAYGTFPFAAIISAGLFKLADRLAQIEWLDVVRVNKESIAVYFDVLTFLASAALILTLYLPGEASRRGAQRITFSKTFDEIREGFAFIGESRVVRAVMLGMGTALLGGGLVIPLGTIFADRALGAGDAGYSLLLTAIGVGAAIGVLAIVLLQKRLNRDRMFGACVAASGLSLVACASCSSLLLAILLVGAFGTFAGGGFVLGNTILQSDTADALRGRVMAAFYALVRLCLTIPLIVGGFLSAGLNRVSRWAFSADEGVDLGGVHLDLPGVRLTLWLGGAMVLGAAALVFSSLRASTAGVPAAGPLERRTRGVTRLRGRSARGSSTQWHDAERASGTGTDGVAGATGPVGPGGSSARDPGSERGGLTRIGGVEGRGAASRPLVSVETSRTLGVRDEPVRR